MKSKNPLIKINVGFIPDLYTENINDPQYDIRSARKCKISRLKEINNDEEHPLYKCFNYDIQNLKKESRFKLSNVGSFIRKE